MRTYPQDSPEAISRVLALAMIGDGALDPEEVETLESKRAFRRIGISREGFLKITHDFCLDLLCRAECNPAAPVPDDEFVAEVIGSVVDPDARRLTARLMIDVLKADGRLADGEATVFWKAMDRWGLRMDEVHGRRPKRRASVRNALRRVRPLLSLGAPAPVAT